MNGMYSINSNEKEQIIKLLESNLSLRVYYNFKESIDFVSVPYRSRQTHYYNYKSHFIQSDEIELNNVNPILLAYLKSALNVKSLNFKYLAYYNILEYFFQRIFEKKLNQELNDKFKDLDNKYYTIDNFEKFANIIKTKDELTQLKYVLNEFVSLSEFKSYFNIDSDIIEREISSTVKTTIIRLDIKYFIDDLSNHIYNIRNSIVHSKPNFKSLKPLLYNSGDLDKSIIRDELNLIRWIAETIIDKTSN